MLDWLVVGNGVVGATTACLLADAGFSVAVLDSVGRAPAGPEGWDLRTYSLTPASRRILSATGVWPLLDEQRIAPYARMAVWEAAHGAQIDFDAGHLAQPALGYILEQSCLWRALQAGLSARPRVARYTGTLACLEQTAESATLTLANGQRLQARALVACDGPDSPLRQLAGMGCDVQAYPQQAVIANVETGAPHDFIARQCFLAEGPLAFLPLPDPRRCSIVWSMSPAAAEATLAQDDAAFSAALGRAFDHRLGPVLSTSARLAFPLRRQHALTYSEGRVVLVGDAAHVVHPLAGQGLNLGLLDAAVLAERAAAAGPLGLEAPAPLFRRYERQRRGEVLAMLAATDGLNRLFLYHAPWAGWLRSAGLALTQRLAPMKQLLMAHAMGDLGDLPQVARLQAATNVLS